MPIQIVRNDITKMPVDAIVNAANERLLGGGGVDGAIHRAAGPGLLEECRKLHGCPTGQAKITGAYNLPCKYVIHTVGPIWRGGDFGERELLVSAYRNSMELAKQHNCDTVAFPLISAGVYGYPKAQAIQVAMDTVSEFLMQNDLDMTVYIVVFNRESFQLSTKLFDGVRQYIDDHYVELHTDFRLEQARHMQVREAAPVMDAMMAPCAVCEPKWSLEEALDQLDESFSEMVLRKIQEKGMKNADCYKKANLDRKHFSKLAKDINYKPKKTTALAIAIALELSLSETKELLSKAGLALSHSSKFDIIVEYFILQGNYDIFAINEVLFYYDQLLLGAVG